MRHREQWIGRVLRWGPIQMCATVGFSLYLWHEPVMLRLARWHILYFLDPLSWIVSATALVAASITVAWFSYRLIEQPGVRLQKLFADLRTRQRFRLDAREADGFYVTPVRDEEGPAGRTVLHDPDERLAGALNGDAGLIEVSPGGLITAAHPAPPPPRSREVAVAEVAS